MKDRGFLRLTARNHLDSGADLTPALLIGPRFNRQSAGAALPLKIGDKFPAAVDQALASPKPVRHEERESARLHVRRAKKGTPATHPLMGDEMRALRKLRKEAPHADFVFTSERGTPFSTAGFAKLVERAGEAARLGFKAHPHMLRHACGYKLANDGHDTRSLQAYLGHKNIQHTVRYTELSSARFKNFWR